MSPASPVSTRLVLQLRTLQWVCAALVVFATKQWLVTDLTLGIALVPVGLGLVSVAIASMRRELPSLQAALLVLDTVLLTALFAAAGGASNPFTFLYLLPVVLVGMTARPAATWGVFALAGVGYAVLFLLPADPHAHHKHNMAAHLTGMWVAYGLSGMLITWGVTQLRNALEATRELQRRTERLTSLATLAAGAAHELGSPLGTIAVIATELERTQNTSEVASNAALIRSEVERCRNILQQLSVDAGAGMGETPQTIALADLVEETIDGRSWSDRLTTTATPEHAEVRVAVGLVTQATRRLIDNAMQASPDSRVSLGLSIVADTLQIEVSDDGPGMPALTLSRATEPFFTTKPTGEGMGLGLHFVRSVAESLGGRLELESVPLQRTTATLSLPHARATP